MTITSYHTGETVIHNAQRTHLIRTTAEFCDADVVLFQSAVSLLEDAWRDLRAVRDTLRPSSPHYEFVLTVQEAVAVAELSLRKAIAESTQ